MLHTVMTLLVHADENARGFIGIISQVNKPTPFLLKREQELRVAKGDYMKQINSTTFRMKNAIVAVEEDPIIKRITTTQDEVFEQYRANFPFDCHSIQNCDLNRQTIMINLNLLDNTSLKTFMLNILVEHRP